MAIGVDTSKRKPRQVRGTPSHIIRNRIAYAVLGVASLFGLAFHYSPFGKNLRENAETIFADPIEEIERKFMIGGSMVHMRTGSQLRKMMEEEKNIARPDK